MEKSPPETLVAFLQAILQAETQTDSWKNKLFYFPPQLIFSTFQITCSQSKLQPDQTSTDQTISLDLITSFIESSQLKWPTHDLQKVIAKYFAFTQDLKCPKQTFIKRLKPINNKLILNLQKQSIQAKQCLKGLFGSILLGYDKMKQKRQACAKNINTIFFYFHNQVGYHKGMSKQSLKEIMFQANIYGRINFSYLKEYIFGEDQQVIGWQTLLGVKLNKEIQRIEELSEQNIPSEQVIKQLQPNRCNISAKQVGQITREQLSDQKSVFIESVSQIKNASEPISIAYIPPTPVADYSKVLSQIDHIESLLNKTKERYQKNRQDLQNETNILKSQKLVRSENLGKLSNAKKNSDNYKCLFIQENREPIPLKVQKQQQLIEIQTKPIKFYQKPKSTEYSKTNCDSPYKDLKPNHAIEKNNPLPFMTRQQMKSQINQTLHSSKFSQNSAQLIQRREVGKIKRRSVSKDLQRPEKQKNQNTKTFSPNYSQFESVLQQIRREQGQYKRMVEQREKILYEREIKQRIELNAPSNIGQKYIPSTQISNEKNMQKYSFQKNPKIYTVNNSPVQSRYCDVDKYIETNNLSRSRVSSKKREEIVQKATSQARLRIQQIENRALKRLGRLDTDICEKNSTKPTNYLRIQLNDGGKTEFSKYKSMKENTTTIRPHQSPQTRNFFINDLLNQRPTLKLSTGSSSYKTKN